MNIELNIDNIKYDEILAWYDGPIFFTAKMDDVVFIGTSHEDFVNLLILVNEQELAEFKENKMSVRELFLKKGENSNELFLWDLRRDTYSVRIAPQEELKEYYEEEDLLDLLYKEEVENVGETN